MTKGDLLKRISHLSDDTPILIGTPEGWSNVDQIHFDGHMIYLEEEKEYGDN